ncbi:hypothetical protein GQ43DRAFT_250693 [Delitschia confertaspora ATCC 74209]|uniref:Uncharacterized protein n=1 Tax=Delitschia confertaspora ATCC 74209 TaxID=1513339 RepID=A0A9P4JHG7_9PLEO|nr:hypothetical protein GQ43DRAFT_250693 [Delitschia confertaspora ATCC 74209]
MLLLWVVAGGGFFFVLGVEVAKVVDDRHPYTFVFLSTLRSTHPTSSKLDGPVVPSLTPSLQSYISSGYPRQAIFFITHCLSSCLFLAQHLAPPRHHHHHFVVRPRRFAPIGLYSTASQFSLFTSTLSLLRDGGRRQKPPALSSI